MLTDDDIAAIEVFVENAMGLGARSVAKDITGDFCLTKEMVAEQRAALLAHLRERLKEIQNR